MSNFLHAIPDTAALAKERAIFSGLPPPALPSATFVLLLLLLVPMASAFPQNIPVHGRITSITGTPVSGAVTMQFRIYNASSGGTALYDTGTTSVQADSSGLYNYTLSNVNLPFDDQYYLGVATMGEPETTRIGFGSVGYSYYSFRSNVTDLLNPANNYTAKRITMSQLLLNAGTSLIAPLVFASGANLSILQDGAVEFDGSGLYFTLSGSREKIAFISDIVSRLSSYYTKTESDSITANLNASISSLNASKGNLEGGNTWRGTQQFYGPVYMANDTYMVTVAVHEVNGSLVIQDLAGNAIITLDAGNATVATFDGDVQVNGELYVGPTKASLYLYNQTSEALTPVAASYYNKSGSDSLYRKIADSVPWSSLSNFPSSCPAGNATYGIDSGTGNLLCRDLAVGSAGPQGPPGQNGTNGANLTMTSITNNGDGTYTWHFSDGTNFTTGNLTGPQGTPGTEATSYYGEMYNSTTGSITLTTEDFWYNVTGFAAGELSGWYFDGTTAELVCNKSGMYRVTYQLSMSLASVANELWLQMTINDTADAKSLAKNQQAPGAYGTISYSYFQRFGVGDRLKLQVSNQESGGKTLTIANRNVNVLKVGN